MSKKQVIQYNVGDKVQFESTGYIGYLNSQTLKSGWENRVYIVAFAKRYLYNLSDEYGNPCFGSVEHVLLKPFTGQVVDETDELIDTIHDLAHELYQKKLTNNKLLDMAENLSDAIDLSIADTADDIYDLVSIILAQREMLGIVTKDNIDLIHQFVGALSPKLVVL